MANRWYPAGHTPVVHVSYPAGYGLHLLGLTVPFPPAPVLWLMMAVDVAATVWAWRWWRRPDLWPVVGVTMALSAYLTVVGILSIGPLFLVLLVVQALLLSNRLGHPAKSQH